MTITEFLRARYAEEEAAVDAGEPDMDTPIDQAHIHVLTQAFGAPRVLADIEAKRAIVEQVSDVAWGGYAVRDVILGHLAAVYADHPDYRQEWQVTR